MTLAVLTEGTGGSRAWEQSDLRLQHVGGRAVGRRRRGWLDPSGPHVGQELLGDLGQDVLGQPGHAQDVVSTSVHVIPERHEL